MREIQATGVIKRYVGIEPAAVIGTGKALVQPVDPMGAVRTVACPAAYRLIVGTVAELEAEIARVAE